MSITIKRIVMASVAVITTAVFVLAVLPQLPEAATSSSVSVSASHAEATGGSTNCPLKAKTDRIIINFEDPTRGIISNQTEARAFEGPITTNVPVGTYKVSLASFDNHFHKADQTQPHEEWFLMLQNNSGNTIVKSKAIRDLPDDVETLHEQVQDDLKVTELGTKAIAYHNVYPDTSNFNSIKPICAALDPIPVEKPKQPVCPYEQKDGRVIVEFDGRIRSDRGGSDAVTKDVSAALPKGTYTVSLASWDGYIGRENTSQPNEQWMAVIADSTGKVAISSEVSDIPDGVREGFVQEVVDTALLIKRDGTFVFASHFVFPDTSSANSVNPICAAFDKHPEEPNQPVCALSIDPSSITEGGSAVLLWTTENAATVSIDNGIGLVADGGSLDVSPTINTIYVLTATAAGGTEVLCEAPLTVLPPNAPICEAFTGTPSALPVGGGGVELSWLTSNADSVSIDHGVGAVALSGTTSVSVTETITYVLSATKGPLTTTCEAPITVDVPATLTCDSFTASPDVLPVGGGSVALAWDTTGATSVSIDQGIGSVSVDGTINHAINSNTTFTLTATNGSSTITCTRPVTVNTGGGGGGSSSPRCDLEASKTKIRPGEEVTLTWDNTRTNDMTLIDSRGNTLIDTDEDPSFDEDEGSIVVKPTRDTKYTLTAIRGSKERECHVNINVDDDVTLTSTRTQEPLVAGISLTSVPYTGFEAGPMLTAFFYTLLIVWGLGVAYILVIKDSSVFGFTFSRSRSIYEPTVASLYSESTMTSATPVVEVPVDRGTHTAVLVEEPVVSGEVEMTEEEEDVMVALESHAHNSNVLLSTDAIRFIEGQSTEMSERFLMLDTIIDHAKAAYPSEDGWLVVNKARITELFT